MDNEVLLHTLLQELKNGVLVCDSEARIILFNTAAASLFNNTPLLDRGSSLYGLCYQPPVEQALMLLAYQQECSGSPESRPFVQFMNKAAGREQYFRCRISLLADQNGPSGEFVIVFEDISAWYGAGNPLFKKVEDFRAPMTNLRAAVENLTDYPEMSPIMRSAFENVLVQETINLTRAFDSLARSCRRIIQAQDHLAELDADVLFGYAARHMQSRNITVTAAPAGNSRVKVDIYGLMLIMDYLADNIGRPHKEKGLSGAAHAGDKFIYFDLVWTGEFITTGKVEAMLEEKPPHSVGGMNVAAILHSMDGDIWSQQLDNGRNMLRLALPKVAEDADE